MAADGHLNYPRLYRRRVPLMGALLFRRNVMETEIKHLFHRPRNELFGGRCSKLIRRLIRMVPRGRTDNFPAFSASEFVIDRKEAASYSFLPGISNASKQGVGRRGQSGKLADWFSAERLVELIRHDFSHVDETGRDNDTSRNRVGTFWKARVCNSSAAFAYLFIDS